MGGITNFNHTRLRRRLLVKLFDIKRRFPAKNIITYFVSGRWIICNHVNSFLKRIQSTITAPTRILLTNRPRSTLPRNITEEEQFMWIRMQSMIKYSRIMKATWLQGGFHYRCVLTKVSGILMELITLWIKTFVSPGLLKSGQKFY